MELKMLVKITFIFISQLILNLLILHATDSTAAPAAKNYTSAVVFRLSRYTIGTNASQTVDTEFDISSSTTTVSCGPAPAFDPTKSSTFRRTRCPRGTSRSKTNIYSVNCTAQDTASFKQLKTKFSDPDVVVNLPGLAFRCTDPSENNAVTGFALGSHLSFISQVGLLSVKNKVSIAPLQFAYCMPIFAVIGKPEKYGIFINSGTLDEFPGSDEWPQVKLLIFNDGVGSGGYAVGVKNMTVGAAAVKPFPKRGLTLKLSTVHKYTELERSVYKAVRASFRKSIGYGERVNAVMPVEPFDTCFDPTPLIHTGGRYGPELSNFPSLELLMSDDGSSSWDFPARNVVVFPQAGVACMGILNAGRGKPSILGTYQQSDQILHYDLINSKLGIRYLPFNIYGSAPPVVPAFG